MRRLHLPPAMLRAVTGFSPRRLAWGTLAVAIFVAGTIIGTRLEGVAAGLSLAGLVILTPFLVIAGLFYDPDAETSVLPTFKALLGLILLCWTALEVFALGAFVFSWGYFGRVALLLVLSTAVAFLIFSRFAKRNEKTPEA